MMRDPSVRSLRLHRRLWWELHSYSCQMTAAVGNTVRGWLITNVMSFYLSVFLIAIDFVQDTVKTSTFVPLLASAVQTFLFNNATYLADDQIGRDFIEKIFSHDYKKFSEDQLGEIDLFLYSIENSGGRFLLEQMVEPSRQTILDILALALTIIVVLLQFRDST